MTTNLFNTNRMQRFFFAKNFFQNIIKLNSKIYLINCIYKINRYRMSLCIIIDVTSLNIIFYVVFCFLFNERMQNYEWMLKQLHHLCEKINVSDFIIVVIDNEKSLIVALSNVFSTTRHLLCLWHINKNVLTNCKIWFDENDEWKEFYAIWQKVIYANTKTAFNETWETMRLKHENDFLSMNYLDDLLRFNRKFFFRCFTNQILHFDNTITFKNEFDHAQIKRELRVFTDKYFYFYFYFISVKSVNSMIKNFKVVVDKISLLLKNERSNYLLNFENDKNKVSSHLQNSFVKSMTKFIIIYALTQMWNQHKKLKMRLTNDESFESCTHTFMKFMNVSC